MTGPRQTGAASASATGATPDDHDIRTPARPLAAWREGDPVGDRRFVSVGASRSRRAGVLPDVTVAYETWGTLNERAATTPCSSSTPSPVTATSSAPAGPGHPSPGLVGRAHRARAPARHRPATSSSRANVLGGCQGTTGPSSTAPDGRPWGEPLPVRHDPRPGRRRGRCSPTRSASTAGTAVLGGSMGGMRALEWAVDPPRPGRARRSSSRPRHTPPPTRSRGASPSCSPSAADPAVPRRRLLRAPATGPQTGHGHRPADRPRRPTAASSSSTTASGAARRAREHPLGGGGRYAVESYLDHHAGKLARRFDANSYLVLTEAMNSHDVGRDRGGLRRRAAAGDRAARAWSASTPTGSTRCGSPTRSPRQHRAPVRSR